ncbi:MAG: methionyl-tRNA formyltransferase, partial [Kiloniellales bacterium]
LVERGEEVIAVYCAPDREGRPVDPLKQAAVEAGLPVRQPASFKDPAVLADFQALAPELCVMAYVVLLVPEAILNAPTHGTIQYHPSLLPRHRGPSSINWPIIQGDTKTGLSIFWPDKGLDTGPILLQKEVEIGPDDTLGSLYFDRLFPMGVDAMLEAVDMVKAGTAPRIPQDESAATYEGWCTKDDVAIDWNEPVHEVYNLIRGANPQPGAWTTHGGRTLQIFDCAMLAEGGGAPGQVTEVSDAGVTVAAGGGRILVKRVRGEGGDKLPAGAYAADSGLALGTRLG